MIKTRDCNCNQVYRSIGEEGHAVKEKQLEKCEICIQETPNSQKNKTYDKVRLLYVSSFWNEYFRISKITREKQK